MYTQPSLAPHPIEWGNYFQFDWFTTQPEKDKRKEHKHASSFSSDSLKPWGWGINMSSEQITIQSWRQAISEQNHHNKPSNWVWGRKAPSAGYTVIIHWHLSWFRSRNEQCGKGKTSSGDWRFDTGDIKRSWKMGVIVVCCHSRDRTLTSLFSTKLSWFGTIEDVFLGTLVYLHNFVLFKCVCPKITNFKFNHYIIWMQQGTSWTTKDLKT